MRFEIFGFLFSLLGIWVRHLVIIQHDKDHILTGAQTYHRRVRNESCF